MSKLLQAVYEKGSLKPLESVDLVDGDRVWIKLVPAGKEVSAKLTALDELVESCDELTADQWRTFEEASARRPLFRNAEQR